MTGGDALGPLLRRFAALRREDRDFVLGLLGQAEREAVLLACDESAGAALSPRLAALVDHCRSEALPKELTSRAARALLAAVDAATGSEPIEQALRRSLPQRRGWRGWRGLGARAA